MSNYSKLTLSDDGTQLQILNNNCANFDAGMENVIRILDDTLKQLSNYNGTHKISNDIEGIKTIKGKISDERDTISDIQTCYSKYYNGMVSADYEISNYIKLSNASNDRYSIGLNKSSNEYISVKSLYEDFNLKDIMNELNKDQQDEFESDFYEYIKTLQSVATDKDLMQWINNSNLNKNLEYLFTSHADELRRVYGVEIDLEWLTKDRKKLKIEDWFGENAKYKGLLETVALGIDTSIEACKATEEAQEKGASMNGTVLVRTTGSFVSGIIGGEITAGATAIGASIGSAIPIIGTFVGGIIGFGVGICTSTVLEEKIINPIEDTIIDDYLVKDINEYDIENINFELKAPSEIKSYGPDTQGININLAYSPWINPIL